jgi:hypothetical protein
MSLVWQHEITTAEGGGVVVAEAAESARVTEEVRAEADEYLRLLRLRLAAEADAEAMAATARRRKDKEQRAASTKARRAADRALTEAAAQARADGLRLKEAEAAATETARWQHANAEAEASVLKLSVLLGSSPTDSTNRGASTSPLEWGGVSSDEDGSDDGFDTAEEGDEDLTIRLPHGIKKPFISPTHGILPAFESPPYDLLPPSELGHDVGADLPARAKLPPGQRGHDAKGLDRQLLLEPSLAERMCDRAGPFVDAANLPEESPKPAWMQSVTSNGTNVVAFDSGQAAPGICAAGVVSVRRFSGEYDAYTCYLVKCRGEFGHVATLVWRRYTEFDQLRNALVAAGVTEVSSISFPPWLNPFTSQREIERDRVLGLTKWLARVIASDNPAAAPALRDFLCCPAYLAQVIQRPNVSPPWIRVGPTPVHAGQRRLAFAMLANRRLAHASHTPGRLDGDVGALPRIVLEKIGLRLLGRWL